MDAVEVAGCFRDKTILVTGSTGFLGKLLVEKILRVQPDVKKLYLLVRAPDAASAEQRILSQVLGKDLFNTLREKHGLAGFQKLIKEKIVPLAGDVGTRDFGLNSSRLEDLCEEIDIIIHGAATTSFYERYDVSLATNALGAQYGCEFAKKCPNLKMLLHVSTAFVAGTQEGLLPEKALKMGQALRLGYHLDIEAELQLVEKVKTGLTAAKSGGSDQSEKTIMKELGLKRTIDALIVAYDEQAFPCFVGDLKDTMDALALFTGMRKGKSFTTFDDTNLTRMRKEVKMNGNDGSLFNFDVKSMDWHQYLLNVHVPAVLKYGRKKKGSV
ncbi:hypothetical protein ACQ4PT_025489 [Festuca glaucescens]